MNLKGIENKTKKKTNIQQQNNKHHQCVKQEKSEQWKHISETYWTQQWVKIWMNLAHPFGNNKMWLYINNLHAHTKKNKTVKTKKRNQHT